MTGADHAERCWWAILLAGQLSQGLGLDCVVIGFILSSDAIHAPNEHYDMERPRRGTRSWVRIFEQTVNERRPIG